MYTSALPRSSFSAQVGRTYGRIMSWEPAGWPLMNEAERNPEKALTTSISVIRRRQPKVQIPENHLRLVEQVDKGKLMK
jgi:hypothetical protein